MTDNELIEDLIKDIEKFKKLYRKYRRQSSCFKFQLKKRGMAKLEIIQLENYLDREIEIYENERCLLDR